VFGGELTGGNPEDYRQTDGRRRVDCIPTCIPNRSDAWASKNQKGQRRLKFPDGSNRLPDAAGLR